MSLLLDTHAAIWWWLASPRLGVAAHRAIVDDGCAVAVSAVSAIEIAIKYRIGKLDEFGDPATRFPALMAKDRFVSLPVSEVHALHAGMLAGLHRDPFDRIIAAQALIEGLTVVTIDPAFAAFGCQVLW